jgi:hypothetical protein
MIICRYGHANHDFRQKQARTPKQPFDHRWSDFSPARSDRHDRPFEVLSIDEFVTWFAPLRV